MRNPRLENRNNNLALVNPHSNEFNFDVWAKQVRDRMLSVLQKRLESNSNKK
jgi:hypothetical protein